DREGVGLASANLAYGRPDQNAPILSRTSCRVLGIHVMIRMNDFTSEPEELRQQELAALERVFRSGRFILGNELEQFEDAWAKFCGVKFCLGVANGMEAIEIGLRALDIGPGDEVITTAMTAIATVLGITRAGATPILADIQLETALLDLASVERCLTPRTKAVLLVHLYG